MVKVIGRLEKDKIEEFNKILSVLRYEENIAKTIENMKINIEGYLHDGKISAIYSFSKNKVEIETKDITLTRLVLPPEMFDHDGEQISEYWQKTQAIIEEVEWVIENLQTIDETLDKILDKIDEYERVIQKLDNKTLDVIVKTMEGSL